VPRKLGEALARRSELQARIVEVRDRLRVSALVQEEGRPAEAPDPLLAELDEIADELERLIAAINQTNSNAQLTSGMSLTSALARKRGPAGAGPLVSRGGYGRSDQPQPVLKPQLPHV
jgi:hypothetical protein